MNYQASSSLPTIYADMNIYRYIACGDINIEKPERFKWVYSHVHLAEIMRSQNNDALKGMEILKAIEIKDIVDLEFKSYGKVVLQDYVDPNERYKQHQEAVVGYENYEEDMIEYIIRLYGADNFNELSLTPEKIREHIDRLTEGVGGEMRTNMLERTNDVSIELKEHINKHLTERRPIDLTRHKLGVTSTIREQAMNSDSPIDEIWKIIRPAFKGVEKDQFFGFKPIEATQELEHTQHSTITGAYGILNMIGLSPDKGLASREKIRNIMSDGQHVGMASYCNALFSADKRLCEKARAIYKYVKSSTNALNFKYQKGCNIQLLVSEKDVET